MNYTSTSPSAFTARTWTFTLYKTHTHTYIYCTVLKCLATPSDFHIPSSIVTFAHSQISFTHRCIYPIFPGSSGTASFFPSFRFLVNHNFWQLRWVHSLDMTISNELFSGYLIQYHILHIHFFSNALIHFSI